MFIIGYKLLHICFRLVVTVTRWDLGTRLIIWYLRDQSILFTGGGGRGMRGCLGRITWFLRGTEGGGQSLFTQYKRERGGGP